MGGGRWQWQCGEEGGGEGVFVQGTVKGGAAGWERGSQCSLSFLLLLLLRFVCFFWKTFFIYLGGEERERTSSRCVGVALKVVPMAHAATLTHGCTPAVPGGTVTYFS